MGKESFILFGVLNWGLGHATRSIPIIGALREQGFTPVLASDGEALQYLKTTFPDLPSAELPSYNIHYSRYNFTGAMLQQLPKIARTVKAEKAQAGELVEQYRPKGIISDNRLGFFSKEVPAVYITHQLKIRMPLVGPVASWVHRYFIKKYHECWVPDLEDEKNSLGGELSHIGPTDFPVRYIGPLSQLGKTVSHEKQYDAVVLMSGPEPQRSLLEKRIIRQLEKMEGRFFLVRGSTKAAPLETQIPHASLLTGAEIAELIHTSGLVISRSGYSSIMDYYFMGNKALLVPTPGQVEQGYLATYLRGKGIFYSVRQKDMNLRYDISEALTFPGLAEPHERISSWPELFNLFKGK